MDDSELFADLSRRLRDAHRAVGAMTADDATKQAVQKRLIALTDASKHDLATASKRLDALLADLDAGRYGQAAQA